MRKLSPAGRIASWASWAFLTLLRYARGERGTEWSPKSVRAWSRAALTAVSDSVVESVRM